MACSLSLQHSAAAGWELIQQEAADMTHSQYPRERERETRPIVSCAEGEMPDIPASPSPVLGAGGGGGWIVTIQHKALSTQNCTHTHTPSRHLTYTYTSSPTAPTRTHRHPYTHTHTHTHTHTDICTGWETTLLSFLLSVRQIKSLQGGSRSSQSGALRVCTRLTSRPRLPCWFTGPPVPDLE